MSSESDSVTRAQPTGARRRPIRGLRKLAIFVIALAILGFTGGVSSMVQRIFDSFGPAVLQDLEWITLRGAKELAAQAEVGLAAGDTETLRELCGDYAMSEDVVAIVAVDDIGAVMHTHGVSPFSLAEVFSGTAGVVRQRGRYLVSWERSEIEGTPVGRIAIVLSTRRLVESEHLLDRILFATWISGLLGLLVGVALIWLSTRAIEERDAALATRAEVLEATVAERTAELQQRNEGMRVVMDHVAQGLFTVSTTGVIDPEYSAIVEDWFDGRAIAGERLQCLVGPPGSLAAELMDLGLEEIREGIMPLELLLEQLPRRVQVGARWLEFEYTPVGDESELERLLVVITDISAQLAREQAETEQKELLSLMEHLARDRAGLSTFFAEARRMVARLDAPSDDAEEDRRLLHTLKGSCSLFGLDAFVAICHEIEERLMDSDAPITEPQRRSLKDAWQQQERRASAITVALEHDSLQVSRFEHALVVAALDEGRAAEALHALHGWALDPIEPRLWALAVGAKALAWRRRGVTLHAHVDAEDLRVESKRWAPFWSALAHVLRNTVEHGIAEDSGSAAQPCVYLAAAVDGGELRILVGDNGPGIDWDAVADRARERGFPSATPADLERALMADGLTTRRSASTLSGRGVGLAAVRDATIRLGGRVLIDSKPGEGTRFVFVFSASCVHVAAATTTARVSPWRSAPPSTLLS
ncbi:MAG: Hpt domain-containing protein [Myxococcales bacterium]|nr:Hpt domain-containing protein [Myxococcales bacterium]